MKKKILSLALVCLMIMTAIVAMLPTYATSGTYASDDEARAAGMVCRVGTTYYSTYEEPFKAIYSNKVDTEIVIINDIVLSGIGSTNSMDIGGNTYDFSAFKIKVTGAQKADGSKYKITSSITPFYFQRKERVTVNNLDINVSGSAEFAILARATEMHFNKCTFTATNGTATQYFSSISGTNNQTKLKITGEEGVTTISITSSATGDIFRGGSSSRMLLTTLTDVTLDTRTTAPNLNLFVTKYSSETMYDIANITDSTLSVGGNGFTEINSGNYKFYGNTTITCGGTVFLRNVNKVDATIKYPCYIYVNDNAKFVASELFGYMESTDYTQIALNTFTSTNPNFFFDTDITTDGAYMYNAPTLIDGASVRTTEDTNGLRFTAIADTNNFSIKKLGMLVAKTSAIEGKEFTIDGINDVTAKKNVTVEGEGQLIKVDNGYAYSVALTGIPDVNTRYSARAYAQYTLSDVTSITVYSAYTDENIRSLAYVANEAVNDVKDAKDEANGYICKLENGKYSPYSQSQYAVVQTYAAQYDAAKEN